MKVYIVKKNLYPLKMLYTQPAVKSHTINELNEIIGPAQSSYSLDLWLQQIASDQAMLSDKSEQVKMIAKISKIPKQKIYRYNVTT